MESLTERFTDEHILEEIQASESLSKLYEKFEGGGPKAFASWWMSLPTLTKQSYQLGILI